MVASRMVLALLLAVLAPVCPLHAQDAPEAKWWEQESVRWGTDVRSPFGNNKSVLRSEQPADLRMAKALAKHDWASFVDVLDPAEALSKRLKSGDETALYEMGLMSIYRLCVDKTIQDVIATRTFERYNTFVIVTFYGATDGGWLRPAGGLYADREQGFQERRDDEDTRPWERTEEKWEPEPTKVGKKAHLPNEVWQRALCLYDAPSVFDGVLQCGGIVNCTVGATVPRDGSEQGEGSTAAPIRQSLNVLGEILWRPAGLRLPRPSATQSSYVSAQREPVLFYDMRYEGKRYLEVQPDGVGSVWPGEWSELETALAHFAKAKTGDEQVASLRQAMAQGGRVVPPMALAALRSAGLGQRPLREGEIDDWMKLVHNDVIWDQQRLELFLLLLPGSWDELRDQVLPVVEELKLDEDGIESVVEALSKLPEGPEVENVIKALNAYVDK